MGSKPFDINFYEYKEVLGNGAQAQVLSFQMKEEFMQKEEQDRPKYITQGTILK